MAQLNIALSSFAEEQVVLPANILMGFSEPSLNWVCSTQIWCYTSMYTLCPPLIAACIPENQDWEVKKAQSTGRCESCGSNPCDTPCTPLVCQQRKGRSLLSGSKICFLVCNIPVCYARLKSGFEFFAICQQPSDHDNARG
jgi:hypothetical protein